MNLTELSREFFKLHKVYRYKMKKISDMDDRKVIQACHGYYEDNKLLEKWLKFRGENETVDMAIIHSPPAGQRKTK